ncbi:MAG: class GN sortase [Pseudomonadota bacterium]
MATVMALGVLNLAQGMYIPAKAGLAQYLMQRAWQRGESAPERLDEDLRPWPWADTQPIARLTADVLDDELFILSGSSGRTLAFGPGHLEASVMPGDPGNSVVAGHRDTHFRFLADVEIGDRLVVDRRDGIRKVFEIANLEVVDSRRASVALDQEQSRLTLVTCYPFDALERGPLRYVVTALPIEQELAPAARTRRLF